MCLCMEEKCSFFLATFSRGIVDAVLIGIICVFGNDRQKLESQMANAMTEGEHTDVLTETFVYLFPINIQLRTYKLLILL